MKVDNFEKEREHLSKQDDESCCLERLNCMFTSVFVGRINKERATTKNYHLFVDIPFLTIEINYLIM